MAWGTRGETLMFVPVSGDHDAKGRAVCKMERSDGTESKWEPCWEGDYGRRGGDER